MQRGLIERDEKAVARLQEIRSTLLQFEKERKKNSENINAICKIYEEIDVEPKSISLHSGKLKCRHNKARKDIEQEINLVKKALMLIQEEHSKRGEELRKAKSKGALMALIFQNAMSLPLWVGLSTESPPPLCGAVPAEPDYIAKVGDMVAALTTVSLENENDWILAEVTGYNEITQEYIINDIDERTQVEQVVHRDGVIPLPLMRANPETNPDAIFPEGALVLALYPQSTCFYKALVYSPPTKADEPYSLLFEDSSYRTGYSPAKNIHQRYVINCIESDEDE